jgi:hypothetical protein
LPDVGIMNPKSGKPDLGGRRKCLILRESRFCRRSLQMARISEIGTLELHPIQLDRMNG